MKTIEQLRSKVTNPEYITQEVYSAYERSNYQTNRRNVYPPVSEQMDMYYWDNMNGTSIAKDVITDVKTQFPKPMDGDEELLGLIEYKQFVRYDSKEAYELAMANK